MKRDKLFEDFFEEISNLSYGLRPRSKEYEYAGITETMILDKRKEISEDIDKILNAYKKAYDECLHDESDYIALIHWDGSN